MLEVSLKIYVPDLVDALVKLTTELSKMNGLQKQFIDMFQVTHQMQVSNSEPEQSTSEDKEEAEMSAHTGESMLGLSGIAVEVPEDNDDA